MIRFSAATAVFRGAVLALGMTAAASVPATAEPIDVPSGAYVLDKTHATIIWRVKHMGLSEYVGRFTTFDLKLDIDGEAPENSKVSATVDPLSVSTPFPNGPDFDKEVSTDARFLNGNEFPEITFVSTAVEKTGDTTLTVTGDLTMLGATHSQTFDVEVSGFLPEHPFAKKPAIGFHAVGTLNRTDYGMGFLAPQIVAPEVTVEIIAEFSKAD